MDLFLPELTKVYISPIVEEMLGYPQASYYTDHDLWERSIHPEDHVWVHAEWEAAFRSDTPYDLEYRFRRADGKTVWLNDRAAPLRDAGGTTIGWQGVMIDITAQKEAELALRASETRHRALIDQLPAVAYLASDEAEPPTPLREPERRADPWLRGRTSRRRRTPTDRVDRCRDRERVLDGWLHPFERARPFDLEYRSSMPDGRDGLDPRRRRADPRPGRPADPLAGRPGRHQRTRKAEQDLAAPRPATARSSRGSPRSSTRWGPTTSAARST